MVFDSALSALRLESQVQRFQEGGGGFLALVEEKADVGGLMLGVQGSAQGRMHAA